MNRQNFIHIFILFSKKCQQNSLTILTKKFNIRNGLTDETKNIRKKNRITYYGSRFWKWHESKILEAIKRIITVSKGKATTKKGIQQQPIKLWLTQINMTEHKSFIAL